STGWGLSSRAFAVSKTFGGNLMRHATGPAALALLLAWASGVIAAEPQLKTVSNSIGMKLVPVPAGEFMMGNHDSAASLAKTFGQYESERIEQLTDELPLHKVRITKPFYLGATEVTKAQFR